MTSVLRPYSSDMASQSRAAQRKQRLLEIENEQRMEEAEALKITPEERRILFQSFQSVKVEFSDLDGLSWKDVKIPWSPPGLPPTRTIPPSFRAQSFAALKQVEYAEPSFTEQALSVLTNTHFPSHAFEETVRVLSPKAPRPRLNSQLRSSHSAPALTTLSSLTVPSKRSSSPTGPDADPGHVSKSPRSSASEHPSHHVAPLPASQGYESDSDRTICGLSDEEQAPTSPRRERKKPQKSRRSSRPHRIAATVGHRSIAHDTSSAVTSGSAPPTPMSATTLPNSALLNSSLGSHKVPFPFLGSHAIKTTTASN